MGGAVDKHILGAYGACARQARWLSARCPVPVEDCNRTNAVGVRKFTDSGWGWRARLLAPNLSIFQCLQMDGGQTGGQGLGCGVWSEVGSGTQREGTQLMSLTLWAVSGGKKCEVGWLFE